MQCNRNGGGVSSRSRLPVPLPPLDRVRGLGICDVLCVELDWCQIESLVAELDEQRRSPVHGVSADERDRFAYERDVLEMIGRQVHGTEPAHTVIWGSARVMRAVVVGAACHAAAVLLAEASDGTSPDALAEAGRVAAAWAETLAELFAVESYSFDPDVDPLWP